MGTPTEEAGDVARNAIKTLSVTPALLALVIMQLIIMGMVAFTSYQRNIYENSLNEMLVSLCKRGLLDTPVTEGRSIACEIRR